MSKKDNLSIDTASLPEPTTAPATQARSPGGIFKRFLQWEASGVLIALIVLSAFLAIASPNFLTTYNLTVVIREASFVGLVALGLTLVLLLGGIDLSVGAAAALSAIIGGLLLKFVGYLPGS